MEFNPFDPATIADPYPLYEQMRRETPMYWCEEFGGWMVTRYADARDLLRDPQRFSSERQAARRPQRNAGPYLGRNILNADPPDHTRLRRLVVREFTPRASDAWAPRIEAIVEELMADLEPAGTFDVMDGLAVPLPVRVIAEMLGVPPEDRALFKRWSDDTVTPILPNTPEDEAARRMQSRDDLAQYFRDAITAARARSEPRADLISSLVAARDQGDQLSEDELLSVVVLLLLAGNETTTNLIGNGTLALN
ncbi:MAG: cytochrome P450, partial [Dehalococcoidia bacterium]